MKWPRVSGVRATVDKHGIVDRLPDDYPVDYWVCYRVDEPWTWRVLTNQFRAPCARCGAAIIFRVSEKSPTEPGVQKICTRCAERLIG